jgi:hypothetical protein
VDEVKLDDADLAGSIHQIDKQAVVHFLIPAEMNLSIGVALGQGANGFIKLGERNRGSLDGDRSLGIDRYENDFGGCIGLAFGRR